MDYKVCPLCGSKYFVSTTGSEKVAFNVLGQNELVAIDGFSNTQEIQKVNAKGGGVCGNGCIIF